MEHKMNIYIDSNIWLDLYHFSNNDLEEFSKLQTQSVNVFLPEQTKDEVNRNRLTKINDARKQFEEKFSRPIPNLYKEFINETETFQSLMKDLNNHITEWKESVAKSILDKSLKADKVISELFDISTEFPTDIYYERATRRMNIGNPPGKNNSYGDAINWESLLDKVPCEEDLYIITDDKDYYDDKNKEIANSFLSDEWESKKKSRIYVFSSLQSFFKQHFKIIKLKEEETKNNIIEEFEQSGSFQTTHRMIPQLERYLDSLTDEEQYRIIEAGCYNGQISSILQDSDVEEFYRKLLDMSKDEPFDYNILVLHLESIES